MKSPRLKYHIDNIGIYQYLSNNYLYENKHLEKIKKLYNHAGKCDNQQQLKYILEYAIVYTPEGFTNDSLISSTTSTPVKKTSDRKSLCLFTNILDVNQKTASR